MNISSCESQNVFGKFEDYIKTNWNTRRGRKSKHTAEDVFLRLFAFGNMVVHGTYPKRYSEERLVRFERLFLLYEFNI